MNLEACPSCGAHRRALGACPHCGAGAGRLPLRPAVLLLSLAVGGCAIKDGGETAPAAETGETGETAECGPSTEQPEYGGPYVDDDGDGFLTFEDCDDADVGVNPCAGETRGDGIDSNCDGSDDT